MWDAPRTQGVVDEVTCDGYNKDALFLLLGMKYGREEAQAEWEWCCEMGGFWQIQGFFFGPTGNFYFYFVFIFLSSTQNFRIFFLDRPGH